MNNIAAKNTANPLLKAVPNVKNVTGVGADPANDDAPSFKDIFSKQIKSGAEPELDKGQIKLAKEAKEIKPELTLAAETVLPTVSENVDPAVIDPAQLGMLPADVLAKELADSEKQPVAETLAVDPNAAATETAGAAVTPQFNPVMPGIKAESSQPLNARAAEPATDTAVIAQQTPMQAATAIKHDSKRAADPAMLADAQTANVAVDTADDAQAMLGSNFQKTLEEGQDFARNLSNSLAKVAEMQAPLSPAAVATTTTLQAQAQGLPQVTTVNTYFGAAGWDKEVSQKVIWMVGGAEQSATLTLNPPDLGPVQVVINVNNEHVDASFMSDNPEVRQALQDGVETLREMMKQSGVELGQTNVSAGNQQKSAFEQAEQARQQMQAGKGNGAVVKEQETVLTNLPQRGKALEGLVNTFA